MNWEGAPGHPKQYCDSIFYPAEVKRIELQNGALREALDYAYEALKGYGCDCGTDEPGTCGECYLKAFFKEHPSEKPKCEHEWMDYGHDEHGPVDICKKCLVGLTEAQQTEKRIEPQQNPASLPDLDMPYPMDADL